MTYATILSRPSCTLPITSDPHVINVVKKMKNALNAIDKHKDYIGNPVTNARVVEAASNARVVKADLKSQYSISVPASISWPLNHTGVASENVFPFVEDHYVIIRVYYDSKGKCYELAILFLSDMVESGTQSDAFMEVINSILSIVDAKMYSSDRGFEVFKSGKTFHLGHDKFNNVALSADKIPLTECQSEKFIKFIDDVVCNISSDHYLEKILTKSKTQTKDCKQTLVVPTCEYISASRGHCQGTSNNGPDDIKANRANRANLASHASHANHANHANHTRQPLTEQQKAYGNSDMPIPVPVQVLYEQSWESFIEALMYGGEIAETIPPPPPDMLDM